MPMSSSYYHACIHSSMHPCTFKSSHNTDTTQKRGVEREEMERFSSDSESPISLQDKEMVVEENIQTRPKKDVWSKKKEKKGKAHVFLEGYVERDDREREDEQKSVSRTKSLTDGDLDELKGCLDLGFGFSYEEIPELCNTLPALQLCYSMSRRFLDEQHHKSPDASSIAASAAAVTCSSPIANWKISSPGDHPEEVKARLKFWAQAVACTVRLCR